MQSKTVVDYIKKPVKQVVSTNIDSTGQAGFNFRLRGSTIIDNMVFSNK